MGGPGRACGRVWREALAEHREALGELWMYSEHTVQCAHCTVSTQSLLWAGLGPGWFGGGRGLVLTIKTYGFRTIWNSIRMPPEVVARPAARTPHPTRAGGQDDGSYTNSTMVPKQSQHDSSTIPKTIPK